MTTHQWSPIPSEKGVALVSVLLLLAVMSALTTGLSISGQTEIAMASNEMYYAGARAAAEAGLSRARERIMDDSTTNLLDTRVVPAIGNGPFTIGTQYSYTFDIMDDDDPSLYPTALSEAQLTQMGEDGIASSSINHRLILRATGLGPRGTRVVLSRVLEQVAIPDFLTTTTSVSNPAILVDGSLEIGGNVNVQGSRGNIHANGNVTGTVSGTITGDITAIGTIDRRLDPDGMKAGNMPPINVPDIRAADYKGLADWILKADGSIRRASDNAACGGRSLACPSGWTYGAGAWGASGSMPDSATYYVEGPVSIHGTGASSLTPISIIAEGSITITGNGTFTPENDSKIQFVTNGDFTSNADADDPLDVTGQIMVREQLTLQGGFAFQGRIVVKNRDSATNVYDPVDNPHGRRGDSCESSNDINGNITVTYNGSVGDIVSTVTQTTVGPTVYSNNVTGWIEQSPSW